MSLTQLSDDSPVDPDDELLVAYLDGELDTKTRRELEDRLLEDEPLRIRLQELQSSWEWLEALPNPVPSEKLVETTLEFVVSDLNVFSKQKQSFWSRHRWGLSTISLCLVAVTVAVTTVTLQRRAAYRQELADLAIAEDLKAYVYGTDMKLMRQLSANPSWNQAIDAAAMVGDLYLDHATLVAAIPLKDRGSALPTFSLDDRARLASKWDQFEGLTESEREKVRRTAAAVSAQPDAESLMATMRTYAEWQESLEPASLRDDLASQDQGVRAEALKKAIEMTLQAATRRSGALLDEETVERIFFALRQILKQRIEDFQQANPEVEVDFEELDRRIGESPGKLFFFLMLDGFSRDGRWGSRDSRSWGTSFKPRALSIQELADIEFILNNNAIRDLEYLSGGNFDLKSATLNAWAEEAIRRKAMSTRGEKPDLLQEYLNYEPESRSRLDLMPPDEILDRLLQHERGGGPPGLPPRH